MCLYCQECFCPKKTYMTSNDVRPITMKEGILVFNFHPQFRQLSSQTLGYFYESRQLGDSWRVVQELILKTEVRNIRTCCCLKKRFPDAQSLGAAELLVQRSWSFSVAPLCWLFCAHAVLAWVSIVLCFVSTTSRWLLVAVYIICSRALFCGFRGSVPEPRGPLGGNWKEGGPSLFFWYRCRKEVLGWTPLPGSLCVVGGSVVGARIIYI